MAALKFCTLPFSVTVNVDPVCEISTTSFFDVQSTTSAPRNMCAAINRRSSNASKLNRLENC